MDSDVIVVGAGLAGLAAAKELRASGKTVTLLEARNRIGGRIHTIPDPATQCPVELGAEFIHGRIPELCSGPWRVDELAGAKLYRNHDGVLAPGGPGGKLEQVFQAMQACTGADLPFSQFLEAYSQKEQLSAEDKSWLLEYIEGFNAADPGRVSIQWLVQADQAEAQFGEGMFRFHEGYEALLADLATDDICLSMPVSRIEWKPGSVTAFSGRTFEAGQAIITVPLGVLKSRSIEFSPALPKKEQAAANMESGPVIRATLRLAWHFWEKPAGDLGRPWSKVGMLLTHDPAFPTWWTGSRNGEPLLTAWAAGSRAERLSRLSRDEIGRETAAALARVTGCGHAEAANAVEQCHTYNWQTDPFALGSYSYVRAGHMSATATLAAPVQGTLFFAGEATNQDGRSGTVDGALTTGRRAAREALQC